VAVQEMNVTAAERSRIILVFMLSGLSGMDYVARS